MFIYFFTLVGLILQFIITHHEKKIIQKHSLYFCILKILHFLKSIFFFNLLD